MTDEQKLIIQLKARGVKLTGAQLKQLNGQVKASKMGMMAMGGAVIAATAALYGLVKVVGHSVKVGKEFEKSLQNLKAISGATKKEIQGLEKEALRLGRTTKFTASEVANLQTEYAKLGFKPDEITEATEATLALAAATGTELANAAAVAGSNVRAFGLDTTQTSRVTDVMALSFSKSALDMQKFTDSMSYIAPVAKMAGFEIEGATAMVGTLANAGISGSMAGTALRRIFLELSNEGSKLAQRLGGPISSVEELTPALEKLKAEGISTADMKDLVGQRAMSAFSVLMEGTETTNELADALRNAGGAAQKMAEVQLDSLDGKLKILNSAWEGFGIALYERFETPLKNATDAMTEWVGELTEWTEVKTSEKLARERTELNVLTGVLKQNIDNERIRKKVIDEINKKYPDFLGNMDEESITLDSINGKLEEYNQNFLQRIKLSLQEEKIAAATDEINDALEDQIWYAEKIEKALQKYTLATGIAIDDSKTYEENIRIQQKAMSDNAFVIGMTEEKQKALARANEMTGNSYKSMFFYNNQASAQYLDVIGWMHSYNKQSEKVQEELDNQAEGYDMLTKVMDTYGLKIDDLNNKDIKANLDLQVGETVATDEDLMDDTGVSEWVEPAHIQEGRELELSILDPEIIKQWEAFEKAKKEADIEFMKRKNAFDAARETSFSKQAEELAFELKAKGEIQELSRQQVGLLAKKLAAGESEADAIKEVFELEETLEEKREAFREAREAFNAATKEANLEDAEQAVLKLENMGAMKDATYEQVEAVAALMDAGKTLNESLGEVFGPDTEKIIPFISPEEAQSMFDQMEAIEQEYLQNTFSIKDNKLAHELEMYDTQLQNLAEYLAQQVQLQVMSETEAGEKIAKIREQYEKKKRQATFQTFSSGISMMSSNLNAAAEAGIVSQKTAKKVAIVSTVIKTYESAVNAFNSLAGIPFVGPALGAAAAAAAVASGMAQVEQIKAQNEENPEKANVEKYISAGKAAAKAAEGGLIGGKPHSEGGTMIEAEKGEFILKKTAVDKIGVNLLHQLNNTKHQFSPSSFKYQEGGLVDTGIEPDDEGVAPPVNISFSGNVLSRDFVEEEVIEVLQDFVRRGGEI